LSPETNPELETQGEAIIDLPADEETGLRVGRVVLFGPVGSGKTLLACALAKMMVPASFKEKYILSPVATGANQLPDYQWYKIDPTDKTKVEAFMASLNEKRAFLMIDEADAYFGGSGRTYGTPSMFGAVNWGRNACLSIIVIAHGTNVAPKNLIANAQAVMFFNTTEVNLLKYAREYMSNDVPDPVYTLQHLPQHVFLIYAPLSQEKFVGFGRLNIETGEIEIWKPEEEPTEEESTTPSSNEPEEGGEPSVSPMISAPSSSTLEAKPNG